MKREKQQFLYHFDMLKNKGQILFLIISLILVFLVFLFIIINNLSSEYLNFVYTFNKFISLKSLAYSGLSYAFYKINANPNFSIDSAEVLMPQGKFLYSVTNTNFSSFVKMITVEAELNDKSLKKILKATVTINSNGKILDYEIGEE